MCQCFAHAEMAELGHLLLALVMLYVCVHLPVFALLVRGGWFVCRTTGSNERNVPPASTAATQAGIRWRPQPLSVHSAILATTRSQPRGASAQPATLVNSRSAWEVNRRMSSS